jgi:transcriptional regulator with XRE-family HTH domain
MDAGERFRAGLAKIVAGSTKSGVARAAGLSRSHLERYLSGEAVPSLTQAERIAGAFGMTLEEILGAKSSRKTPEISPIQAVRVLAKFVREKS